MQYKDVANTHMSAGGWDTVQFVVMHSMLSQSLIVTLHTYICKLSLETHLLDLDVNGNVLLDIGLKD